MKVICRSLATFLLLSQLAFPITSISEIQNVYAAESNNSEKSIDEWMPDKNLQSMIANNLGKSDFSQEDMLNINNLEIFSSDISDMTGISYAKNLTSLSITDTDLSNTKNLNEISSLTKLNTLIATNDNMSDMSVFENTSFSNLTNLNLSNNSFSSLDTFNNINLPALKMVNLSNNKFDNINNFNNIIMPNLEDIDISYNNITDASPLLGSKQIASIKKIDISHNKFHSFNSITGINFPNLESLNLSNNDFSDISILETATVPKLINLDASYNQIEDISPIAKSSVTSLTNLIVNHNRIKNIDAFKQSTFVNLEMLDVSYNQIEDISIMNNLVDTYPKLNTYKVDNNRIGNIEFMNGYSLTDSTSAFDQNYTENVTFIRPTLGIKSIEMPIRTSNFVYNNSNNLYLGTSDPEGNTLTISNVKNAVSMTKYDGTTISFIDGNNESATGIKTFEVDSSSLPESITFEWNGANGAFSGSGIININWIDAVAPTIEANDKTIEQGSTFDPLKDISAFDQQNDGSDKKDLTSSIKVVSNSVDTSKTGIYKVEYSVTNSFNISTTKSINVTVKEKKNDAVAGGNVTAKYLDTTGIQIHDPVVKSGNIGQPYGTKPLIIDGYYLIDIKGDPIGFFTDQEQTVTYIYKKIELPTIPTLTPGKGTSTPAQTNNSIPSAGNNTLPQSNTPTTDTGTPKQYPATGEKQNHSWLIAGILLILAILGYYFWDRNKKKTD